MISLTLLGLAALWIAVLHRYPALFVPRKSNRLARGPHQDGENWIEVLPDPSHHEVSSMQEVA